jgi:L-amino acid N-acyltransferase YncA
VRDDSNFASSEPALKIRPAEIKDRDSVWEIFHAVVAAGTAYAFDPEMPRTEAMAWWEQPSAHRYVAELDGGVAGIFLLKPNQPGLGAHVANAAFMVGESARGSGVGRAMGEHCLAEARRLGFRAIQFNCVVSTNEAAVRLWNGSDSKSRPRFREHFATRGWDTWTST